MNVNNENLTIVVFAVIGILVGIWWADNMTGTMMKMETAHTIVGGVETYVYEWVPKDFGYIMGIRVISGFIGLLVSLPVVCVVAWVFDKL